MVLLEATLLRLLNHQQGGIAETTLRIQRTTGSISAVEFRHSLSQLRDLEAGVAAVFAKLPRDEHRLQRCGGSRDGSAHFRRLLERSAPREQVILRERLSSYGVLPQTLYALSEGFRALFDEGMQYRSPADLLLGKPGEIEGSCLTQAIIGGHLFAMLGIDMDCVVFPGHVALYDSRTRFIVDLDYERSSLSTLSALRALGWLGPEEGPIPLTFLPHVFLLNNTHDLKWSVRRSLHRRIIALLPDSSYKWYKLSRLASRPNTAKRFLETTLAVNPFSLEALARLEKYFIDQHELEEARVIADRKIAMLFRSYNAASRLFFGRRAYRVREEFEPHLMKTGLLLEAMRLRKEALVVYESTRDLLASFRNLNPLAHPLHPFFDFRIGVLLYQLGHHEKAVSTLTKLVNAGYPTADALQRVESYAGGMFTLGAFLVERGERERGVVTMQQAIGIDRRAVREWAPFVPVKRRQVKRLLRLLID